MGEYTGRLYRPSNGTEGMWFVDKYCMNCMHENPDGEKNPKCDLMTASHCFDIKDPEYPKEWCYDENDNPCCTKWQKWDWGNDGDPNDPDNPNYRPPDNPNQLCFPFILDELGINEKKQTLVECT